MNIQDFVIQQPLTRAQFPKAINLMRHMESQALRGARLSLTHENLIAGV